jgi:hypothetical protein
VLQGARHALDSVDFLPSTQEADARTRPRAPQECDTCNAFCSSSLARGVKNTVECSINLPVFGITAAAHTSDAGQQISYGHGAIRTKGRPPTPESSYLEQFDILINNNVEHPLINRDSVSCRRPHRESTNGDFVPGLDNSGKPQKRTGFMVRTALCPCPNTAHAEFASLPTQVPCSTSSDCFSRCGEHPMTGFSYVCTPNPQFYTFHIVNESLTEETLAFELAQQSSAPGLPALSDYDSLDARLALLEARPKWIPLSDTVTTQSYYVDESGEARFDPPAGSYGVCTDVRMDFMHTNCDSRVGSQVVMALVGCTAKQGARPSNTNTFTTRDSDTPLLRAAFRMEHRYEHAALEP